MQRMNWRQFLFFFPQSMREIKHTHSERDRAATETSLFVDNKFITAWRVKTRSIFSLFSPVASPVATVGSSLLRTSRFRHGARTAQSVSIAIVCVGDARLVVFPYKQHTLRYLPRISCAVWD